MFKDIHKNAGTKLAREQYTTDRFSECVINNMITEEVVLPEDSGNSYGRKWMVKMATTITLFDEVLYPYPHWGTVGVERW